jgi:RNA polymerase primary sigma factor/RNA polymerase sigma factor
MLQVIRQEVELPTTYTAVSIMSIVRTRQLDPRTYSNASANPVNHSGTAAVGRPNQGDQNKGDPNKGDFAAQWQLGNRLARAEAGRDTFQPRPDSADLQRADLERAREAARRQEIVRRRDSGESLAKLAKRFRTTPSRISRIVAQEQFKRVQELQLDYIPNDRFKRMSANQQAIVLGPSPENPRPAKAVARPAGLPPYLASMYETPLLTREQEQHLFRKMNYLKHRASVLRDRLNLRRPSLTAMTQIEKLAFDANTVKNDIVRANLRLVVSIAKRYATGPGHLFELISDGNMSLIRAVEKFDFARGFRFSTYASWAIMKNFARTIPAELRQHARFRTGGEDRLMVVADAHVEAGRREAAQSERQSEVSRILKHLDERERQIIRHRFGLDRNHNPMTLKEVGRVMGVTKERIRQLEARAMAKLRDAVGEERVEAPEPGE